MEIENLKSFNYRENGVVEYSTVSTVRSTEVLDSGSYRVSWLDSYPNSRVLLTLDNDFECVKIKSFNNKEKLDNLFNSFFNKSVVDKVAKLGFCHKTGVLLYGKEGTGKTSIMKHYYSNAIKQNDAIVFHITHRGLKLEDCWKFIQSIRNTQDNPIIVVFDEMDGIAKDHEALLKTIFDGGLSIDNCIFLASTNYMDAIPKALKDRESRFKYCIEVGCLTESGEVRELVDGMIGDSYTSSQIDNFSSEMQNKTLDEVKQFCMDKIMDLEIESSKKPTIGFC